MYLPCLNGPMHERPVYCEQFGQEPSTASSPLPFLARAYRYANLDSLPLVPFTVQQLALSITNHNHTTNPNQTNFTSQTPCTHRLNPSLTPPSVRDLSNLKTNLSATIADRESTSTDLSAWKSRMETVEAVLHKTKASLASLREKIRIEDATLADMRVLGEKVAIVARDQLSEDARATSETMEKRHEAMEKRLVDLARQLDNFEVDVAEWTQWVVGVGAEMRKVERKLIDVDHRITQGLVAVRKAEYEQTTEVVADEKLAVAKSKL